jgi:transposase
MMNREELEALDKSVLVDLVLALTAKVMELTAIVAELEARLNQNSSNSSKPPSSDGFRKPPKSLRKPSGKAAGGQYGHEGSGFKIEREPDEYVIHDPVECGNCPNKANCTSAQEVCETRYEVDISIQINTKAHQATRVVCPLTQTVLTGSFPANIKSTMQYGVNLEALAISLNTVGMVSVNRTHEILSGVFGVPISTGTISSMVSGCAETVAPSVSDIKETIKQEPVVSYDETGTRVNKKTFWAHVASTDKLTHIEIQEKRGKEGINALGILMMFLGTAIHDCFAAYFGYACRHGLCNAHLLRDLTAVWENTKQLWSQKLMDLLLAMKKTKEKLLLHNTTAAPLGELKKYSSKYDEILAEALADNPVPERIGKRKPKRGTTGALVDRLILRKEQYLLFFTDFAVPFDNNQAERDFRMFKVKQKVSGCFRTFDGARDFATISSYVGTARKNGIPAFAAIKNALLGEPFSLSVPVTE